MTGVPPSPNSSSGPSGLPDPLLPAAPNASPGDPYASPALAPRELPGGSTGRRAPAGVVASVVVLAVALVAGSGWLVVRQPWGSGGAVVTGAPGAPGGAAAPAAGAPATSPQPEPSDPSDPSEPSDPSDPAVPTWAPARTRATATAPSAPTATATVTRTAAPTSTRATSPAPRRTRASARQEAAALKALYDRRDADRVWVELDRRWVAQLASKYVGIRDRLQRAADGSNRFGAVDILAEHRRLRREFVTVFLVRGDDYGPRHFGPNGEPLWVTFAFVNFAKGGIGSAAEVRAWCDRQFAGLSPAQRKNACVPRQLLPLD